MPVMNVNDIEIYYEIHGKGPALLCIQGYSCNRLIWQEFLEPLSNSYQIILFDNRGCGQSSAPEMPYTIEMMANDTAGLLKALNIDSCFAIGHSMGGAILQQMCLDHPGLVRKAILANTFAKAPEKWKRSVEWLNKLGPLGLDDRTFMEGICPWIFSEEFLSDPIKIRDVIELAIADPYPQSPAGMAGQYHALSIFDIRSKLSQIQTPVLIASGDEDIGFPLYCAEEMAENIPNSELVVFQGQAHQLLSERTEEMVGLIKEFLK